MTQWDKVELMRLLKAQVDSAIKSDRLKPNDGMKLSRITNGSSRNTLTSRSPRPRPRRRPGTGSRSAEEWPER